MGFAGHWGAALAATCIAAAASAQECSVASGPQRAALVELYTSEGCSSCPPADRQLSQLESARDGASSGQDIIPLAWHVDFWDYIGWKDPFARAEFTARQRMLIAVNGSRTLYTPHFFVNGQEIRDRSRVAGAIRTHTARSAGADIRLAATARPDGRMTVAARVEAARPSRAESALAVYAAITESGLSNRIAAGENRGATLRHDHVVRHWFGPVPVKTGGATLAQAVELTPEQRAKGVTVTAFVQDTRSGEVLQAVSTGVCKAN